MKRLNWNTTADAEFSQSGAVVREIARLCRSALSLDLEISADLSGFNAKKPVNQTEGILSATARIADDDVLMIRLELVRAEQISRVNAGVYFEQLSRLGPRVQLVPPEKNSRGETSLWVELKVKAVPLTPIRENAFLDELAGLQALAKSLRSDLGRAYHDKTLVKQYKEFKDKAVFERLV